MNPWVYELGICIGFVFMAWILLKNESQLLRKMGELLLIGTSGLAVWFWTKNIAWALFTSSLWIVLPLGQAIWISRRLMLSLKRSLESGHFDDEQFPEVTELSQHLRKQGFIMEGDCWLKPSTVDQGYRLFLHKEENIYAAIGVLRHGIAILHYLMLLTPSQDRKAWLTWDYPMAYGLLLPPEIKEYRYTEARSVEELVNQHREFLKLNKVQPQSEPASIRELFEKLFNSTIEYNIRRGLLRPAPSSKTHVNYTWRGTAFVSWKILKEVVGV